MLAVTFTFPAGRYHATAWDRHVNEGAVAWPPEPWRILRALIATWHHKVKSQSDFPESTLITLIESLSADLPTYHLPPGNHSHTRHYMPQFKDANTKLVLDAFVALDKQLPLTVMWKNLELVTEQVDLLDALLDAIGYLGRAESWVEARRVEHPVEPDCLPSHETQINQKTSREPITLFAPLPDHAYQAFRSTFLRDARSIKSLAGTLPETLLDALSLNTSDLKKKGWNQPPASRRVTYLRPLGAIRPQRETISLQPQPISTALFMVLGKPLPRVEDSLRIGEVFRRAVMSRARHVFGRDSIPSVFSGHNRPEGACHRHAFFIPWDADGDGHIDRLVFYAPDGLGPAQSQVVESLRSIYSKDGGKWSLVLEASGGPNLSELFTPSRHWTSVTPYLHPWHLKKGFQIEDQIRRECRARGMPEPSAMQRHEHIEVGMRRCRPSHFRRFRSRRNLRQPDRHGSFWHIEFAEPIPGPLAFGFACHYGLGLFSPVHGEKE